VLLFVVLFYVYPLKFMFDSMFAQIVRPPGFQQMTLQQLSNASAIYGLGFFALMMMFVLLYLHACASVTSWGSRRSDLRRQNVRGHHLVSASVGIIALLVAVAAPLSLAFVSPMCFALMGPGHWWFGKVSDRRRKAIAA
jgi:hypothetical protein